MADVSSKLTASQRWTECLLLLVVIVPLWLLTRDLFAGSAAAFAEQTGLRDGLREQLRAGNAFHAIVFYEMVMSLGDWTGWGYLFWARVVASLLVIGVFAEQAHVAQRLFGFDREAARWLSLAATLTPFWYTLASSDITAIALWWWLMLLGWRIASDPSRHSLVRVIGLPVLALSFTWPSLMVFALAMQGCLWWRDEALRRRHLAMGMVMLAVAVTMYSLVRWVVPPSGYFSGTYNVVLITSSSPSDWLRMVRAAAMFGTWMVVPCLACALVMAWVALGPAGTVSHSSPVAVERIPAGTFARATLLLGAASLAYVAVGKGAPLFTPTAYGQGITEQLLRATHYGAFSPTWANTSQRHAVLLGLPLAAFSWALSAWLLRVFGRGSALRSIRVLFGSVAIAFLVWLVPSYHNKLAHQAAELSLVGGLRQVSPPPPGFVSLRYGPVADWFIGPGDSNLILRTAWGSSVHYSLFHAIDAAEREQQWIFHAYVKAQGGVLGGPVAHFNGFQGPLNEACMSTFEASLPVLGFAQIWTAGLWPDAVPPAQVRLHSSDCREGRTLPNPMPGKRIIP